MFLRMAGRWNLCWGEVRVDGMRGVRGFRVLRRRKRRRGRGSCFDGDDTSERAGFLGGFIAYIRVRYLLFIGIISAFGR